MNASFLLSLCALLLAVASFVATGYPLLQVAVLLLVIRALLAQAPQ